MAKLKLIALALAAGIAAPAAAEAHDYRYGPAYPAWGYAGYGGPYPYYDRAYARAEKRAERAYRKHLKREAKAYKKLRRAEQRYYARYGSPYGSPYAYEPGFVGYQFAPGPHRYRFKHDDDWDDD